MQIATEGRKASLGLPGVICRYWPLNPQKTDCPLPAFAAMGFMFDKGTPWPCEVFGGQLKIVICRSKPTSG
ncbi:MAG: hypothetical protein O2951_17490 [Bacteroidetes bacterium]|nr:hypothetical protein [Bacteroidota bacterium]